MNEEPERIGDPMITATESRRIQRQFKPIIRKVIGPLFFVHGKILKGRHGQQQRVQIPDPFCPYRYIFATMRTTRLDPCTPHPTPQYFVGDLDGRAVLCHP